MTLNPNVPFAGIPDTIEEVKMDGVIDTPGRQVQHLTNAEIAELYPEQRNVFEQRTVRQNASSPEPAKPPQLFKFGDLVSWPAGNRIFGTTNVRVVGVEWGIDHRAFKKPVWIYHLRPEGERGVSFELAEESKLSRIS